MNAAQVIQDLHDRCAIYTSYSTTVRLLDTIGWTADVDLSSSVLLEPCVGEGAILLEAVTRLLASFRNAGRPLDRQRLAPRIKGFEIHAKTVNAARRALERILLDAGISQPSARALSHVWVRKTDFLLQIAGKASHVAANPPYVRWSKLPSSLAERYRDVLPEAATRGDLAVAFLDRMLAWSRPGAKVVALTSDRWMFAQYGAAFRRRLERQGWYIEIIDPRPENAFARRVGAYSAIVSFGREPTKVASPSDARSMARSIHAKLAGKYGTLAEAGCIVRVGPALGSGETFLVTRKEAEGIESELVRPFVPRAGADASIAELSDLRVVIPYDRQGSSIVLDEWPGFARWARKHEKILKARSHSQNGAPWWRTIDAIGQQWQRTPKLLLPEMCRDPLACIDPTNAIPAHSLYAIWPGEWPAPALRRVLNSGLLRLTAVAEAPMLKQSWFRFYKRFIVRTPLPKWSSISALERGSIEHGDGEQFSKVFFRLFGFIPGHLDRVID